MKVELYENETADSLIRRFKKAVIKEEILETYRKHECFLKKNRKRLEKSKLARRKNYKKNKNKNKNRSKK